MIVACPSLRATTSKLTLDVDGVRLAEAVMLKTSGSDEIADRVTAVPGFGLYEPYCDSLGCTDAVSRSDSPGPRRNGRTNGDGGRSTAIGEVIATGSMRSGWSATENCSET